MLVGSTLSPPFKLKVTVYSFAVALAVYVALLSPITRVLSVLLSTLLSSGASADADHTPLKVYPDAATALIVTVEP